MNTVSTSDERITGMRLAQKAKELMASWQGSNSDHTDPRQPLASTQPAALNRSRYAITGTGRGPQMGVEGPTQF